MYLHEWPGEGTPPDGRAPVHSHPPALPGERLLTGRVKAGLCGLLHAIRRMGEAMQAQPSALASRAWVEDAYAVACACEQILEKLPRLEAVARRCLGGESATASDGE